MISGARAWSERVVARASFDGARALRLREPNGEDELALDGIDTRAATAFLSRLADRPDEIPALAATDRDALLAALHRGLWGDRILTSLECPACAAMYDLSFELSALQRHLQSERRETRPLGGRSVEDADGNVYHLPSAGDEERAADLGLEAGRRQLAGQIAGGSEADTASLEARLEQIAPLIDVDLEAPCAECGHVALARFDVQTFTLQRLIDERDTILAEVDALASGYGWSLGEILGLARSLRRAFAERAAGAVR